MTGSTRKQRKGATEKLLAVLLSFEGGAPLGVTDLANETGMPKSTIHRLLGDLQSHGLVERAPSGQYQLGYRLWRLAHHARPYDALRRSARPHLVTLAERSRESAFLTAREDLHSICIDKAEGPQTVRMTLDVGTATSLHRGASNRILLAFLPDEEKLDVVRRLVIDADERDALVADLDRIRSDGWAYSVGQLTPGAAAIAVPLGGSKGGFKAGLSIGGPADRFTYETARRSLPSLQRAADLIAASLHDSSDRSYDAPTDSPTRPQEETK